MLPRVKLLSLPGKLWIPVLALLCFSPASNAINQYQAEAGAIYSDTDDDAGFETTLILGGVQYFFRPVQYTNSPYSEASFLNRQSNIIGLFGIIDMEIFNVDLDGTVFGAAFNYEDPGTPLVFGITFVSQEADNSTAELEAETLIFRVGSYMNNQSRILVSFAQTEIDVNGTEIADSTTLGLNYKTVFPTGGNQFVNLEGIAEVEDNDDGDTSMFGVEGDYYLDLSMSIGGGFALNFGDEDEDEGTTIMFRFKKFLDTQSSIAFSFEQFESDNEFEEDEVSIEFFHRF